MIVGLHSALMGAYGWTPRQAWELPLSDALRAMKARASWEVFRARVSAAVMLSPLMSRAEQIRSESAIARATGVRQLSVEEEFGPEVAKDVAEIERSQEEWLKEQRKKRRKGRRKRG